MRVKDVFFLRLKIVKSEKKWSKNRGVFDEMKKSLCKVYKSAGAIVVKMIKF